MPKILLWEILQANTKALSHLIDIFAALMDEIDASSNGTHK